MRKTFQRRGKLSNLISFAFCHTTPQTEHSITKLHRRIELHCKENIFGHQFLCDTKSMHFNTFSIWHYWIKKCETLFLSSLCIKWNFVYKIKDLSHITEVTENLNTFTFSNHDIITYSKSGMIAEWCQRLKVLTHPLFHRKSQTS